MKKIVISGYYGFDNAGDEALLAAIIKDLKESIENPEIVVLSGNPKKTIKLYQVRAINRTNLIKIIQELRNSDLLISGGGSLLQDITGPLSIPYYLGIVQLAKTLAKPVMFYAHGVGPVDKPLGKSLVRIICNQVDLITLRDEKSQETLIELGVTKPELVVTADPVLGLTIDTKTGPDQLKTWGIVLDPAKPAIGFSIRDWKGLKDYKRALAKSVNYFLGKGFEVVFIPMHYPEDLKTSEEIMELAGGKVHIINESLAWEDYLAVIGNLDILVGMRLHALVFAAIAGVPSIGISYDPKVDQFLELMQQPSLGRVEKLDYNEIIKGIEVILENQESIKHELEKRIRLLRVKAKETSKLALQLLNKEK